MTSEQSRSSSKTPDSGARRIAIERLRVAMDSRRMRDAFRRDWEFARANGLEVDGCELIRVNPRGNDEFVIEYALTLRDATGTRRQQVFAEIADGDADARRAQVVLSLQKSRRKQLSVRAPAGVVSALPELGMVVRLPGLDERLPGLKLLHKAHRVLRPLIEAAHVEPGQTVGNVSAEILGHRLGKRCTVRFRFDTRGANHSRTKSGSFIAKMYKRRTDRGRHVHEAMQGLWNGGFGAASAIRIPAPVSYLAEWETFLMEDAPGTPLFLLRGPEYAAGCEAAGSGLARLHAHTLPVPSTHNIDDELGLLANWVSLVGEVQTALREAIRAAFARTRERLEKCRTGETALVHRDYYDKQVLIDPSSTVLIDFDTLARSDPALDVGNFLAHIRLQRAQDIAVDPSVEERFLAGYGRQDDPGFSARVDAYRRATLLRLVCLYSFWPRWREVPARLIGEVG